MQKLFAIAFTCVYLTLAVGVVRTTHYCMGRVKSSDLFSFETKKCPCSIYSQFWSDSCCGDESELIKIDNDYSASWIVSLTPEFFVIGPSYEPSISSFSNLIFSITEADEIPPPCAVPLFRKHCFSIFYDEEYIA